MKVGDLIKFKDGSVGLIVEIAWSPSGGSEFIRIHTGETLHLDCQHLEGWRVV